MAHPLQEKKKVIVEKMTAKGILYIKNVNASLTPLNMLCLPHVRQQSEKVSFHGFPS